MFFLRHLAYPWHCKKSDWELLFKFSILSTTLALAGINFVPFLSLMGNWMIDFRVASLSPPQPQNKEIVVVTITDETLRQFPYRFPVDRAFLTALLNDLEKKEVRAIFLNLLIDQPSEASKDAALKEIIWSLKIPLVVSYGLDHSGRQLSRAQSDYLENFVPPNTRGLANFIRDPLDGNVRWIYPGQYQPNGVFIPGATLAIAAKSGHHITPGDPIPIAWHGSPNAETSPFPTYPAHLVSLLPKDWFKDKIILIGIDLPLTDRHRTSFDIYQSKEDSLYAEGMAGVMIHAHGLAQLLENRSQSNVGPIWVIVMVLLASLTGAGLAQQNKTGWMVSLLLGMTIVLFYWLNGLLLFRYQGVLIPLITPTIGFILAFLITSFYIGERERREKWLAVRESKLKSLFLANMSHEIRTPMNAIIGFTELALESTHEPVQLRSYLETVTSSAHSLLTLLNDILDLSKLEANQIVLEQRLFNLQQLLTESSATMAVLAQKKGLHLEWQMATTLPPCYLGDPHRLRQLLLNLLSNAIKFTQQGAVILKVTPESNSDLLFSVTDSGPGIRPDRLEAIFQSFTQEDSEITRKFGGTGLGLAISKQIVERMGGHIWVESQLGKGSIFYFRIHLPIALGVTQCLQESHPTQRPNHTLRSLRILLAEDVETNVTLAVLRLQQQGHQVTVAKDGEQAVELFKTHLFDLILMDVQMPRLNGHEASLRIRAWEAQRKVQKPIPIIAMTANAMKGDREQCLNSGMNDYISKPIDFSALFAIFTTFFPHQEQAQATPKIQSDPPLSSDLIPDLPGIDYAKGLANWGDPNMYQKALQKFLLRHAEDAKRMRQALQNQDLATAQSICHALKGVAGNLAALDLAAAATALDISLRAEKKDSLEEQIQQVEIKLAQLLQSCQTLTNQHLKTD
ncbi:MAG: ATP-binding protein [Magnetococcus sp. DMHC-6]